jgi:hypothetical protein
MAEVVAFVVLVAHLHAHWYTHGWIFDDSFMFLRYAHNLLGGHGWTWNPGWPMLDGITSPLWQLVVTVAAMAASPAAVESGAVLVMLSFPAMVAALGVVVLAVRGALPAEWRPLAFLAPAWLVFGNLRVAYHGITGMETALAGLLLAGHLALLARAVRMGWSRARGVALGVLAFALVLVRPEFGLVALGCPALALCARGNRRVAGMLGAALATTVVLLALYAALRVALFGNPLPLPVLIKGSLWTVPYEDFSPWTLESLRGLAWGFFFDSWPLHLAAVLLLVARPAGRRLAWLWLPVYAVVAYLATSLPIMGFGHRYFAPLCLGLAVVMGESLRGAALPPVATGPRVVLLSAAAMVFALTAWQVAVPQSRPTRRAQSHMETMPLIADMVALAPPGASVAATEVGILGARARDIVIHDLAGLHDPAFARGFDVDALFAREPDMLTLVSADYRGMTRRILAHPRFADFEPAWSLPGSETPGTPRLDTTVWANTATRDGRLALDRIRRFAAETAPHQN